MLSCRNCPSLYLPTGSWRNLSSSLTICSLGRGIGAFCNHPQNGDPTRFALCGVWFEMGGCVISHCRWGPVFSIFQRIDKFLGADTSTIASTAVPVSISAASCCCSSSNVGFSGHALSSMVFLPLRIRLATIREPFLTTVWLLQLRLLLSMMEVIPTLERCWRARHLGVNTFQTYWPTSRVQWDFWCV